MEEKRIIRVFPRRTQQTPDDDMAFVGEPGLELPEADEVHVSVTFTWDKPRAEVLEKSWGRFYSVVKVGGPAYDDPGVEFVPGRYIKRGVTFTTRGCPNHCSFCYVPKREGALRELPICPGNIVQDNNLLAASREHFERVCGMLATQRQIQFAGGLDVRLLTHWHIEKLRQLKIAQLFLAFDQPGQWRQFENAIHRLRDSGFSKRQVRCYVLMGFRKDTAAQAATRARLVKRTGATPFAMLYRGDDGKYLVGGKWHKLVREWSRVAAIYRTPKPRQPAPLFENLEASGE